MYFRFLLVPGQRLLFWVSIGFLLVPGERQQLSLIKYFWVPASARSKSTIQDSCWVHASGIPNIRKKLVKGFQLNGLFSTSYSKSLCSCIKKGKNQIRAHKPAALVPEPEKRSLYAQALLKSYYPRRTQYEYPLHSIGHCPLRPLPKRAAYGGKIQNHFDFFDQPH